MDKSAVLSLIASQIHTCENCPLGGMRTQAVPGEGPLNAEILFVGEGPGKQEDLQGRPFVGPSGRYLEGLLADIKLSRDQVFITNIIKCRPPNNRDPLPQEIDTCRPYLLQQTEIIDPCVIVTLGRYSMAQFFGSTARITRIHGKPLYQERRSILPLFHPAAALRNPNWARAMKQDFLTIPALVEEMRQKRAQQESEAASDEDLEQLSLF